MFPQFELDLDKLNIVLQESEKIKELGNEFIFDFQIEQHKVIDGNVRKCNLVENVSQWIEKVIRTERGKYRVYTEDENEDFGISIYQYIGEKTAHMGFITSELKREITEQLLKHRYIKSVENFQVKLERRTLFVQFTAILITGNKIEKKVRYNGF